MKILFTILLLIICFSAKAQFIINPYQFTSTPATPDTTVVKVNFSLTDKNVATANDMFGSPHSSVLTIANLVDTTGANTGWSLTTIGTSNWCAYSGISGNDAITGVTGGTALGAWANNATVMGSSIFNYNCAYNGSLPQLRLSGLDPAKDYIIWITGTDGTYGFNCIADFRVSGATTPSAQTINGNVTAQNNRASFTIKPNVSGVINIWANPSSGNDLAMVAGLVVKEIN